MTTLTLFIAAYQAHGSLFITGGGGFVYEPTFGYVGTDTYTVCDSHLACANATVTFNVVNTAPITADKAYSILGSFSKDNVLLVGDSDPDGDPFSISPEGWRYSSHGELFLTTSGGFVYNPNSGFSGSDSYTFTVCDNWAGCSNQTVTFYVLADNDGVNDGAAACDSVGEPINVTNGNMYLQQIDYSLSSLGPAIEVTRTYNSNSQRTGLFGKGWSTEYDESIITYGNDLMRLSEADGRASHFGRPAGLSGTLASLQGDFHGHLTQNGGGSLTLTLMDGSVYQFNPAGKLLSVADRNGNQTTLSYDTNGHLASITNPFGRVLNVTTNANGQVLSLSDSMGTIASYTYSPSNQLLSVTYADNSGFNYAYDGADRLTTVTDALGHITESHTYDSQGRALTSEKQGGVEHYTLSYVSGTETDVTDALGHVSKYTFDKSRGRNLMMLVEGLCSCGGGGGSQVQTWAYDARLNVTAKTDALNRTTSYTYDADGNQLTETDATGTVTYTYNQFGQVLTRTDQMNNVTTSTYDAQGNKLTTKDALNNTTTFTYDARGQLLTTTDARGKVFTFTYDTNGHQTQRKDANNVVTLFFFDARSRLTEARDALNHSTLYTYDAVGRIIKLMHPDNSFVSYTYDLAGRRTKVTDERGHETTYAYDGADRLTGKTDAANHTTSYTYDAMSNVTASTDALGRVTNYEYDDFNRLVKVIYPPATTGATRLFATLSYDAAGNVTGRTDTAGRVTNYAYDNVNRVTSMTDAANKTTGIEYDSLGRVTGVLDALNQHYQFAYDALGRMTQQTRGGHSMTVAYDAVGNRASRTDYKGQTTTYSYDNLNRLTQIAYPNSTSATYAYDALSRLTSAANQNGTVAFAYDERGRVSSTTDVWGQEITYAYDEAGNRISLNREHQSVAYYYDVLNRLTEVGDATGTVSYTYNAIGQPLTRTLPNGVTTSYQYNGLSQHTNQQEQRGATAIITRQFGYNTAGLLTQLNETDSVQGNSSYAYGYDNLNRLTSATYSNQSAESYAYDAVGNRTSSHASNGYQYQGFNQLAATDSGWVYSYDLNGNQLSKVDTAGHGDEWQYSWDIENRLTQVQVPSGASVSYKYDALGRRVERTSTVTGEMTQYTYDGQDVILDTNSDGSTVEYSNGPGADDKLAVNHSQWGVFYLLRDHLGSTRAITDASGGIIDRVEYDSFGDGAGSSSLTRYAYTGREWDADTGLYYYRARWYDSQQGRFLSEDPIGLIGGVNQYAYVENAPTVAVDPSGLQRLAPLGRNGAPRRDVGRAELERLMTPHGGQLPDEVKRELDRGCIGLIRAYQGLLGNDPFPENAPNTVCYLERELAQARKCQRCCRNIVFAKQGKWFAGVAPKVFADGQVGRGAIAHSGGEYNYIMYFPSTRSYVWMNNRIEDGPQIATIRNTPFRSPNPEDDDPHNHYPHTIWCSTCKPTTGRK